MREKKPTFGVKVLSGSSSACQWAPLTPLLSAVWRFSLCPPAQAQAPQPGTVTGRLNKQDFPPVALDAGKFFVVGPSCMLLDVQRFSWLPPAAPTPTHTTAKMSPATAKCPLGARSPSAENYWHRVKLQVLLRASAFWWWHGCCIDPAGTYCAHCPEL